MLRQNSALCKSTLTVAVGCRIASYNNHNPVLGPRPVPGPQDPQRRVTIIVTIGWPVVCGADHVDAHFHFHLFIFGRTAACCRCHNRLHKEGSLKKQWNGTKGANSRHDSTVLTVVHPGLCNMQETKNNSNVPFNVHWMWLIKNVAHSFCVKYSDNSLFLTIIQRTDVDLMTTNNNMTSEYMPLSVIIDDRDLSVTRRRPPRNTRNSTLDRRNRHNIARIATCLYLITTTKYQMSKRAYN